ncbi:MAG: hypothetical protein H0X03_00280 [Nitrosopumilus sp.]|nr:hypothetical protein [Nitrosopumilus sp.]
MKQLNILVFLAVSFSALTLVTLQNQTSDVFATPSSIPPLDAEVPTINNDVNVPNTTGAQQVIDTNSSLSPENKTKIFHSQYLTVSKTSLRQGDFSDSITGTIVNNSPVTLNYVGVSAALFDENNNLLSITQGSVDFPLLRTNEDTSFKIDISSNLKDLIDNYMLFVVGTPQ